MKTIYLVKKNPEVQGHQDNWITMNSYEFAMFMKTEEGKRRRPFFGELDAVDENDYKIVMEFDQQGATDLKKENNRKRYLKKVEAESGYKTFSLNEHRDNEDRPTEETELIDETVDVETQAIECYELSRLFAALEDLSEKDRNLIHALYLGRNCMNGTQYAKMKGVTYRAFTCRKEKIFKKIRDTLF